MAASNKLKSPRLRIVGDIHGHVGQFYSDAYEAKLWHGIRTIGLGDMGFYDEFKDAQLHMQHFESSAGGKSSLPLVLPGNHDYYPLIDKDPYLPMWGNDEAQKIMWVGGAYSIDKNSRKPGETWFPEEEIADDQRADIIHTAYGTDADVILSHDAPYSIVSQIFNYGDGPSRTGKLLDDVLEGLEFQTTDNQRSITWVFGHHHKNLLFQYKNFTFVCLDELCEIYV